MVSFVIDLDRHLRGQPVDGGRGAVRPPRVALAHLERVVVAGHRIRERVRAGPVRAVREQAAIGEALRADELHEREALEHERAAASSS